MTMPDPIDATYVEYGRADAATFATGEPGVLLSFRGGPAQPLAISLPGARDLAAALISALAAHGDAIAQEIGDRYLRRDDPDDGAPPSGWRDRPSLL